MSPDTAAIDFLENEKLRVGICRRGAEMVTLRCIGDLSTGFLHRDALTEPPASGWANHATVMGYFLHRIVNETTVYRGRTIRGGNHGFLRHFEFDEPERTRTSLTYRVPAGRVPPDAYPLPVSLDLSYSLDGDWLAVGFAFENHDTAEDAHVSFGLHPGFAVGSPLTCRVTFPPGRYVRHFAPGNFLDGRTEVIEFGGGPMPFDRGALPDSYLIGIDGVPAPTFVIEDGRRRVALDFAGVPYMTVWSDLGPFLCIEPCWGLPDSIPQKPFEKKDGIQTIPPGGRLTKSFRIQPTIL